MRRLILSWMEWRKRLSIFVSAAWYVLINVLQRIVYRLECRISFNDNTGVCLSKITPTVLPVHTNVRYNSSSASISISVTSIDIPATCK